ncbi:methylaspartate mutase [Streptomyces lancefieldiae]|uniref:Methylaspartate mutase n=1 Tax=Streptomyces lancefieldiae TaxID=3075520 RepID=A0ABU3B086_9ACTN|nr:methylaspartate mutase [Streptomyces sp. DSM 40712]MDT0615227.1 methylaspartate mutase [Streptomyces sp. DSM 40712]
MTVPTRPTPAVPPTTAGTLAEPLAASGRPSVPGSFGAFVSAARCAGRLVVQPRMGMSDPRAMRAGLAATRAADATTVGTLTLDSYTRVGDLAAARRALADDVPLNGYPLVTHGTAVTRSVLDGIQDHAFPVQVRHGSAAPQDIVAALVLAGLDATEGGPVSYCLPYGRTPLTASVDNWARACDLLSRTRDHGAEPHLETFGGCMMGQLCPPSLLVALSVLEALFFAQHGLRSVSLSYAQQTDPGQDEEAVHALRRLARGLLPDLDWHIVVYTYMGVYPRTPGGARLLLEESARLAVRTGAARLIVKTAAEAHRIPTVRENVAALEAAARAAEAETARALPTTAGPTPGPAAGPTPAPAARRSAGPVPDTGVHAEASALVQAVLEISPDLGRALPRAFERGYLDVPYCLHPDNAQRSRSYLDTDGRLRWSAIGAMPLGGITELAHAPRLTSGGLLTALRHVERRFDAAALDPSSTHRPLDAGHRPPARAALPEEGR